MLCQIIFILYLVICGALGFWLYVRHLDARDDEKKFRDKLDRMD